MSNEGFPPQKSVFVFKNYKINLNKRKNGEKKNQTSDHIKNILIFSFLPYEYQHVKC